MPGIFALPRQMLYGAIQNNKNEAKLQDDLLSVDLYLDQVEVCLSPCKLSDVVHLLNLY